MQMHQQFINKNYESRSNYGVYNNRKLKIPKLIQLWLT
uniref:Uncharacterized protein n=1 Tax=Arundo donax TaxID=35708 RepID=A0A0A9A035_ARUDO